MVPPGQPLKRSPLVWMHRNWRRSTPGPPVRKRPGQLKAPLLLPHIGLVAEPGNRDGRKAGGFSAFLPPGGCTIIPTAQISDMSARTVLPVIAVGWPVQTCQKFGPLVSHPPSAFVPAAHIG